MWPFVTSRSFVTVSARPTLRSESSCHPMQTTTVCCQQQSRRAVQHVPQTQGQCPAVCLARRRDTRVAVHLRTTLQVTVISAMGPMAIVSRVVHRVWRAVLESQRTVILQAVVHLRRQQQLLKQVLTQACWMCSVSSTCTSVLFTSSFLVCTYVFVIFTGRLNVKVMGSAEITHTQVDCLWLTGVLFIYYNCCYYYYLFCFHSYCTCLQCFDNVGRMARRASGL